MLDRWGHETLLPTCLERGIGIIVGGVFNSGMLAPANAPGATFDYVAPPLSVRALYALAAEYDVDVSAVALQFPRARAAVVSVIPGARSVTNIKENILRYHRAIPCAFWDALRRTRLPDVNVPLPA